MSAYETVVGLLYEVKDWGREEALRDIVQLVRILRMWRHRFESCMYRTMPTVVGYVCFIVLF